MSHDHSSADHPSADRSPSARVLLGHGAGGRLSHDLVAQHFLPSLQNPALSALGDSAILGDLTLTTDDHQPAPQRRGPAQRPGRGPAS